MSFALVSTRQPLYEGRACTYAEARQLPDDGCFYELIAGVMRMNPSPSFFHREMAGKLHLELGLYLREHPVGIVTLAPLNETIVSQAIPGFSLDLGKLFSTVPPSKP